MRASVQVADVDHAIRTVQVDASRRQVGHGQICRPWAGPVHAHDPIGQRGLGGFGHPCVQAAHDRFTNPPVPRPARVARKAGFQGKGGHVQHGHRVEEAPRLRRPMGERIRVGHRRVDDQGLTPGHPVPRHLLQHGAYAVVAGLVQARRSRLVHHRPAEQGADAVHGQRRGQQPSLGEKGAFARSGAHPL